ncbi:MAG: FdhF/YdeP family oxidoreductase [Acidimicrobiales bacterium]
MGMRRRGRGVDEAETQPRVTAPKTVAAGLPAVAASLRHASRQLGTRRMISTLLRVNQTDGFDCPGCAWPEPEDRSRLEFCENGAKAVAEEATVGRITGAFFAEHPVSDLATRSGYWLGQQGRLTEPMLKRSGSDCYEPVGWDDALDLLAGELRRLGSPDEAVFYTSGRTSNEAAFLYQLLVRRFGTNNLPDCSNMCHESSSVALRETLGSGKGTVTMADFEATDLVVLVGQNPGTNHPRMLSTLERAKEAGARIVAVNPLPEAGLIRFGNPQRVSGLLGRGTDLADLFVKIRVNGDLALFQALNRLLLEAEERRPGTVLDRAFLDEHCDGFDAFARHARSVPWDTILAATGLTRAQIDDVLAEVIRADRIIVCWAMGLTQHRNSVATIREIVNFALLRGNIGRPGAGLCPVRGHSNVQGDRTMGIDDRPLPAFLDRLAQEFDFEPPREPGFDTVNAIRAMDEGRAKVFIGLGGNFAAATPDSDLTAAALGRCRLTVQVSTKLNRSHAVTGEQALILPTLGRTERDQQAAGPQSVTVEDSMGIVHLSQGRLDPASPHLLSEVAIVARLAQRLLGDDSVDWAGLEADYDGIREHIARVVPGFEHFNRRVRRPGGFTLDHPGRDRREFPSATGRARLSVNPLAVLEAPAGRLILQTLRSHDQYNTTIYGLDDRYRGIRNGRRVVLVNPTDLTELGVADGQLVDLVSEHRSGERRAPAFRVVSYPTAPGCCAAYFPETNVLVPLDSTAEGSNTPTSKSLIVRLEAADAGPRR